MSKPPELLPLATMIMLSACATVPNGPSVMVLPGAQKTFEQFREDNGICQYYAQEAIGQTTPGQAGTESATKSAVSGTAIGAATGAIIGAAAGNAGAGATIGADSGLLVGGVAGSSAAEVSIDTVQRRYDIAYIQCMYAKGNQVPVPGGHGNLSSNYQPPPPPPSPPQGKRPSPQGSYPLPPASGSPTAP